MDTIEYPGDHAKDLHNRILGPDVHGDYFAVTDTSFANDVTIAHLRPATQTELDEAQWDKNGQMYLAEM